MFHRICAATLLAILLVGGAPSSIAAMLEGVSLSDKVSVGGKSLTLNGMGLRTATIFNVKVYVMGLYLENKSSNPKQIIDSTQTKRIEMQFVRDVDADDIREGWSDGFKDNYPDSAAIQKDIDSFNAGMRDMKEGGNIVLDFVGDSVSVVVNGASTASIEGNAFQRALLSIWLGGHPPNEDLKKGLLGT